jgi:hypothetical protein
MSRRLLESYRGKFFKSKYQRSKKDLSSYVQEGSKKTFKASDIKNTNIESKSSFRYEQDMPLKSTQQLNIDYTQFENHIFFHSAVSKVNESFLNILNYYPFNGTKKEIEEFEDSLTGYEKYVLDLYPKNIGYLIFSGTQKGEASSNGTQINVLDKSGARIPSISSNKNKTNVTLDPVTSSFSIQFFIRPETIANDNQILFQKKSSLANNFTLFLSNSSNVNQCELHFGITSGSRNAIVSSSIDKGDFTHVTAIFDNDFDQKIKLITFNKDKVKNVVSSSNSLNVNQLKYFGENLNIGSGASFRYNDIIFDQQETFSGSIDEIRYYHRKITDKEIKDNLYRSVNGDSNLVLYYKFNEPYGDYTGNNIVLDNSVNSRNESIKNFIIDNRLTGSDVPVAAEDIDRSPVLMPKYPNVINLNSQLLTSASLYDQVNPNLITKLIPQHYLDLGENFEGYQERLGKIATEISTLNNVRESVNTPRSAQMMVKFLLIWAKHFDELKILIDSFSLYNHVNFEDLETVPDSFLAKLSKKLGVELPYLLNAGNDDSFFKGLGYQGEDSKSKLSLQKIQYTIWRRILSDYQNFASTKGTLDNVKSIFMSSGIDPEGIFHIREYGGAKTKSLQNSTQTINDNIGLLKFSGSIGHENEAVNSQGKSNTSPYVQSGYLSASRVSPGKPNIQGTFINGMSNNVNDGLFTSASFDYHATYFFPTNLLHNSSQSLVRLHTTGTAAPSTSESCVINLVSQPTKLSLFVNDDPTSSDITELFLTGLNIADGNIWAVNFGRINSEFLQSDSNSQYYLRAGTFEPGLQPTVYQTASLRSEAAAGTLSKINTYNTSGSFLIIGSQSFEDTSRFINAGTNIQNTTHFSGDVSFINFWSKDYTDSEFISYAKNPLNYSSKNVKNNYNFMTQQSGSHQKVRIHTSGRQATTASNSQGEIRIFDFSQENNHLIGNSFESNVTLFKNKNFIREFISPNFDLNSSENKIRVRSIQDTNLLSANPFATIAPVYEVDPAEEVFDDTRFSMDMSVMKGLNENIVNAFSDFDELELALGKPNLMFSENYHDLYNLRKIYFENLIEKLNLNKYRELFKWLDNAFTDIVFNSLPRNTKFLGVNFVYESHMLERNKLKYLHDEIYLKSLPRSADRGNIFLSQFVAKIKKG